MEWRGYRLQVELIVRLLLLKMRAHAINTAERGNDYLSYLDLSTEERKEGGFDSPPPERQ
jgi:hypothetical protein